MSRPYTAAWGTPFIQGDKPFLQKVRDVDYAIQHEKFEELLPYVVVPWEAGPMNVSQDPVLSLVIACGKTKLAIDLIEKMPPENLRTGNSVGDTALHVAVVRGDEAVVEALVAVHKKFFLVKKMAGLLEAQNHQQEIPLHKAALCGRRRIVWMLVGSGSDADARRKDGATILHCAIIGNAPELASEIATEYPKQMSMRNEGAVTPLQLVMTIPEAFRSQSHLGRLDSLIYEWILLEESSDEMRERLAKESEEPHETSGLRYKHVGAIQDEECRQLVKTSRKKFPSNYVTCVDILKWACIAVRWAWLQVFYNLKKLFTRIQYLEDLKKNQKRAMELIAYLASDPNYWDFIDMGRMTPTHSEILGTSYSKILGTPCNGKTSESNENPPQQEKKPYRWDKSPLILGAEMGLHEFVKQILEVRPESVRYLDMEGRNVLQVAIQHRQEKIVEIIRSMASGSNPTIPSWLFSSIQEEKRNTILHFAAETVDENIPVIQMQYELQWFERVKKLVPKELKYSRNQEEKTALELFNEKHKDMVKEGKTQLMEMGKTYSGLVAAVVFASSFSVPGEKDVNNNPVFVHKTAFKVFSHAYVIGLSCAATALVLFLSLLTTPYRVRDFRRSLPTTFFMANVSFFLAMVALLVAFTCNIYLNIYGGRKVETKDIVPFVCELTIFPIVCAFVLLYRGFTFGFGRFIRRVWH